MFEYRKYKKERAKRAIKLAQDFDVETSMQYLRETAMTRRGFYKSIKSLKKTVPLAKSLSTRTKFSYDDLSEWVFDCIYAGMKPPVISSLVVTLNEYRRKNKLKTDLKSTIEAVKNA